MSGEAGKGDAPKNIFSEDFRNNYDQINWSKKPKTTPPPEQPKVDTPEPKQTSE